MAINYFNEKVAKPSLKYRLISKCLKIIVLNHSKSLGNISYVFCDDNYLKELNLKYLNHDYFTDIITFDYVNGNLISGDVYISVNRVLDNSVKFKVNLEDEFLRVMIHGILHLLMYHDKSNQEKRLMREKETCYIRLFKKIEHDSSFKI